MNKPFRFTVVGAQRVKVVREYEAGDNYKTDTFSIFTGREKEMLSQLRDQEQSRYESYCELVALVTGINETA